jgi:hypothetical protein
VSALSEFVERVLIGAQLGHLSSTPTSCCSHGTGTALPPPTNETQFPF